MSDLHPDENGLKVMPVVALVIQRMLDRNDKIPLSCVRLTRFHALKPPSIMLSAYLTRIAKYAPCSVECFIVVMVYIDRIAQGNPDFVINSYNVHRLVITSVLLAAKFFDDKYFNNAYYARVGGISVAELNFLELEFLFLLNFELNCTPSEFQRYGRELFRVPGIPDASLACLKQIFGDECMNSPESVDQCMDDELSSELFQIGCCDRFRMSRSLDSLGDVEKDGMLSVEETLVRRSNSVGSRLLPKMIPAHADDICA